MAENPRKQPAGPTAIHIAAATRLCRKRVGNHLSDGVVGATVAVSIVGVSLLGENPKGRRTFSLPVSFLEMQKEAWRKRGRDGEIDT